MPKRSLDELLQEAKVSGLEFLIIDAEMALSFLDLSWNSTREEVRNRCIDDAPKAYFTTLKIAKRLKLDEDQHKALHGRLSKFRDRLTSAGAFKGKPSFTTDRIFLAQK